MVGMDGRQKIRAAVRTEAAVHVLSLPAPIRSAAGRLWGPRFSLASHPDSPIVWSTTGVYLRRRNARTGSLERAIIFGCSAEMR